jgi:radical SAM protein with 4Fe4S-binding SPASM domain
MWKKIKPWILPSVDSLHPSLRPGLYHYRRERAGEHVRFHLRVENSGQALLLAAAVEAVKLTRSGAIVAYGLLEGKSEAAIIGDLDHLPQAEQIIDQVKQMLEDLGLPRKRYPIFNLTDPMVEENPQGLIAPFQADLVLGSLDSVKACLDSLWDAGIPHVRLVDSDKLALDSERVETLRLAVQYAEDIGMITGVRMRASSLMKASEDSDQCVLDQLAEEGLDYVVVPWGIRKEWHSYLFGQNDYDLLDCVIERSDFWEMPAVFEAGLLPSSVEALDSEVDRLLEKGIEHLEVFAVALKPNCDYRPSAPFIDQEHLSKPFQAHQLRQLASLIEDIADDRRLQIVWLPPITSDADLTNERLIRFLQDGPRAGADISIRVEADGNVIPPRGRRSTVGMIQQDSWKKIWQHPSFSAFRDLVNRNEHCSECTMMAICAAHCPADPKGWAIED